MGWITPEDRMPPKGLQVLLEVSGIISAPYAMVADHSFYLGAWIVPSGQTEGHWLIWDSCDEDNYHLINPKVHAWMPLPKHYQQVEMGFEPEEDMMEHAMFEDDPEWLYKGDAVYEQMSMEELGLI